MSGERVLVSAPQPASRARPAFGSWGYVPVDLPPGMSDLPPAPKVTHKSLREKLRAAERA